jgi:hypothetical protein
MYAVAANIIIPIKIWIIELPIDLATNKIIHDKRCTKMLEKWKMMASIVI